jgi:hypothetical protein
MPSQYGIKRIYNSLYCFPNPNKQSEVQKQLTKMANKDLFEQAIADAKALKEISLANAKQQIEETFAPKIQEMFRLKLSEMEDEGYDDMQEDMEREESEMEEGMSGPGNDPDDGVPNQNYNHGKQGALVNPIDEMTLDEILAELELEEGLEDDYEDAVDNLDDGDALEEGHSYSDTEPFEDLPGTEKGWVGGKKDVKGTEKGTPYKEAKKADAEEVDDAEEDAEEAEGEVAELSVEEFKNLVRDIVADVMGGKTQPEEGGEEDLEGGEDMMKADEEGDETISLDEILAEIGLMEGKKKMVMKKDDKKKEDKKKEDEKKEKEDLKEAIRTIHVLKAQLNELNLLNAKLLYVNKLYKAKNLNEGQKVKVLAAFDRATTINEAKNIYATLKDSLQVNAPVAKGQLKESLGFASKPIGSAPARPIVEADSYVYRMQQLAGIKKPNI